MKFFTILVLIMLTISGCGRSHTTKGQSEIVSDNKLQSQSINNDNNQTDNLDKKSSQEPTKEKSKKDEQPTTQPKPKPTPKPDPKPTPTPKKPQKTLVLYVHGFSQYGYERVGVYGDDNYDKVIEKMIEISGFATTRDYDKNSKYIIAITPYYGDTPPTYYTQKDIDEVESLEGIPRYALIIAKFAKYIKQKTSADTINIVSASMGSLVTRYLIEKDLEQLSSSNYISRWISLEGVIKGNVAASDSGLLRFAKSAGLFKNNSPEVKQMKYSWISKNLNPNSPYYKDIKIAFESSTDDHLNNSAITLLKGVANDGVQAVRDTYFDGDFPHTYLYETHTSLDNNLAAWADVVTFLTSHKRVKLTLLSASLEDLHEDRLFYGSILPAEIVFSSKVYSPSIYNKWQVERAIDKRVLKSWDLPLFKYRKSGVEKELNYRFFNSLVLNDERSLRVTLVPYEIDRRAIYGVREITGHGKEEALSTGTVTVPLENGVYSIESDEWSGKIRVEVSEY